jgi:hypothetical protein
MQIGVMVVLQDGSECSHSGTMAIGLPAILTQVSRCFAHYLDANVCRVFRNRLRPFQIINCSNNLSSSLVQKTASD